MTLCPSKDLSKRLGELFKKKLENPGPLFKKLLPEYQWTGKEVVSDRKYRVPK